MNLGLAGKVVVVTGSSASIGHAAACEFAREGAHVVICGRDKARLDAAAAAIPTEAGSVTAVACDILQPVGAHALLDATIDAHGGLDVLVNNLGGAVGGRLIANSTDDEWHQTFDMNIVQTVRMIRLAVPHMANRPDAAIVNVASISGWQPQLSSSGQYGAVKAGLIFDTERWALELSKMAIRVNTVSPGAILAEGRGWATVREQDRAAFDAYVDAAFPMGRLGRPEEVADVIVFLASARSHWINGRSIAVDGLEQPVWLARHWSGSH
jgi:3-oxoacyl-[acyl-carrier protein] reductase